MCHSLFLSRIHLHYTSKKKNCKNFFFKICLLNCKNKSRVNVSSGSILDIFLFTLLWKFLLAPCGLKNKTKQTKQLFYLPSLDYVNLVALISSVSSGLSHSLSIVNNKQQAQTKTQLGLVCVLLVLVAFYHLFLMDRRERTKVREPSPALPSSVSAPPAIACTMWSGSTE